MRFIIAFLLLTTPAFANWGTIDARWKTVTVDGYTFNVATNPYCISGHIAKYQLIPAKQWEVDKLVHPSKGLHTFSATKISTYGNQIFVVTSYPRRVQEMNLHLHEEAILRGCKDDRFSITHQHPVKE